MNCLDNNKSENPKKRFPWIRIIVAIFVGFAIIGFIGMITTTGKTNRLEKIEYTTFLEYLESDQIESTTYNYGIGDFSIVLKDGKGEFKVQNPQRLTLREELLLHGVQINSPSLSASSAPIIFQGLVSLIGLLLLLVLFFTYFRTFRASTQGVASTASGTNGAGGISDSDKVLWQDLILPEEQLDQLKELVKIFTSPEEFKEAGATLPTGVLFYGPPGTGKTIGAQAIATAAGASFIQVAGSGFVEMFVGLGAMRVRKLFDRAIKQAPCVVFIDEIDAVGRRSNGQNTEMEQTVGELLTQMTRVAKNGNVLVIGATNLPDNIDPALKRSGRFDLKIGFELPNTDERRLLLEHYAEGKRIDESISLDDLSHMLVGFSGADIASMLNRAAIASVTSGTKHITRVEIDEAMIQMALHGVTRKVDKQSDEVTAITSIHEAGHAVAVKLLTDDLLYRVSIKSVTSGAGGYTMHIDSKEILHSRRDLENKIKIVYAGRAAEAIFTGSDDMVTTGASSDITAATGMINTMITKYGMSSYGLIDPSQLDIKLNEDALPVAQKISSELYESVLKLLQDNWNVVLTVQAALIQDKVLLSSDLEEIFSKVEIKHDDN